MWYHNTNYSRWFHPEDQQLHSDNYRSDFISSNNQKNIKYKQISFLTQTNRKIYNWSMFLSEVTFVASILMTFKSYISEGGLKAANSLWMEKKKIRVDGIVTLVLFNEASKCWIPADIWKIFNLFYMSPSVSMQRRTCSINWKLI